MTALQLLRQQLLEQEEFHGSALRRGVVKDYAEYREKVGFIRGLETARNLIADLEIKLENDDE